MMQQDTQQHQAIVENYRPIEELIPANWTEATVFANGIRHHYYRTGGNKPPLLLLHGFNENGTTWLRTAKLLQVDFDLIMPDARGHGRSDGIETGYSPDLLVDDVVGIIEALKLGQPRILGCSMGGSTALKLGIAHPQLVRSFIFEGWSDELGRMGDASKSEAYQNWFNSWLGWLEQLKTMGHKERMVATLPQVLPTMGGALWPEDEYVPAAESYAQFNLDLARYSINLWGQAAKDDPASTLKSVTCPALIMKHGFAFPTPGTQPTVRQVPSEQANARILYFENTGHMIRRVAFEQYITLVREFFEEH
jgi:N-formylmaleamate deformylase